MEEYAYKIPVTMDSIGRLLIPAAIRKKMGWNNMTDFTLMIDDKNNLFIVPKDGQQPA